MHSSPSRGRRGGGRGRLPQPHRRHARTGPWRTSPTRRHARLLLSPAPPLRPTEAEKPAAAATHAAPEIGDECMRQRLLTLALLAVAATCLAGRAARAELGVARAARRDRQQQAAHRARVRSGGDGPFRRPLRRLLPVRVRDVAQEQPRARRPLALRPLRRADRAQHGTLRDILQNVSAADPKRNAIDQKIGDYYASCMDEAAIEKKGVAAAEAHARPASPPSRPRRTWPPRSPACTRTARARCSASAPSRTSRTRARTSRPWTRAA